MKIASSTNNLIRLGLNSSVKKELLIHLLLISVIVSELLEYFWLLYIINITVFRISKEQKLIVYLYLTKMFTNLSKAFGVITKD